MSMTRRIIHTGVGAQTVTDDIPAGSYVENQGVGKMTLNGRIGRGTQIVLSGVGKIHVCGDVEEDVVPIITGVGNIIFSKRPPQSVLKNIRTTGKGSVEIQSENANARVNPSNSNVVNNSFNNNSHRLQLDGFDSSTSTIRIKLGNGDILIYRGSTFNQTADGKTYIDGVEIKGNNSDLSLIGTTKVLHMPNHPSAPNVTVNATAGRSVNVYTGGIVAPPGHGVRIGGSQGGINFTPRQQSIVPAAPEIPTPAPPLKRTVIKTKGDFTMGNNQVNIGDQKYTGNSVGSTPRGELMIGGEIVGAPNQSIVPSVPADQGVPAAPAVSSLIPTPPPPPREEKKLSSKEIFMRDCSEEMRKYLQSFENKESHSDIFEKLPLEEKLRLSEDRYKFVDPVTNKIMNRPVFLPSNSIYDFDTILTFGGIDPSNKQPFTAKDVSPAVQVVMTFTREIYVIEIKKKNAIAQSAASVSAPASLSPNPPGGPSLENAPPLAGQSSVIVNPNEDDAEVVGPASEPLDVPANNTAMNKAVEPTPQASILSSEFSVGPEPELHNVRPVKKEEKIAPADEEEEKIVLRHAEIVDPRLEDVFAVTKAPSVVDFLPASPQHQSISVEQHSIAPAVTTTQHVMSSLGVAIETPELQILQQDIKREDNTSLPVYSDEKKQSALTQLPIVSYTFPLADEKDNARVENIKFHQDQVRHGYSNFLNEQYPGYSPYDSVEQWGKWVIKYPKGSAELNQMSHQLIGALKKNKIFNFKVSSPADEFDNQLICVYTLNYQDEKEIQATYQTLIQMGIPQENIMGYKRDIETTLDSRNKFPFNKREDIYLYDNDAKITKNGSIIRSIDYILTRKDLIKSTFTADKKEILNNFWEVYHRYISNKDNQLLSNIDIIKAWVAQYKFDNNGANPFDTLSQQRYTGCGSIFNPTDTDSIKLFKGLVGKEKVTELQTLIDNVPGNEPALPNSRSLKNHE